MRNRLIIVVAVLALIAAACSSPGSSSAPDTTHTTEGSNGTTAPTVPEPGSEGASLRRCGDVEWVRAPDDAYAASPIYVGNEMPIEAVQAWASRLPAFEGIWIDRERAGWITVAFSADADLRQEELAAEFPGVGAVVVAVDWTEQELAELQDRVAAELGGLGWNLGVGRGTTTGVVSIDIGILSEDRLAEVDRRFGAERICVSGLEADAVIPEGPQPEAGEGWRLLGERQGSGRAYHTAIAFDDESFAELWAAAGIGGLAPDVDFETEVVMWFGAVYGSSCPGLRLDDVVVDDDRSLVHGVIVLPSALGGVCTADANPHAFVVALQRDRLPRGPFAIQLAATDPPGGVPEERTNVAVDLSAPGSVAPSGSISQGVFDQTPTTSFLGPEEVIEPGVTTQMRLWTHCGVDWIGLNGVFWLSTEAGTFPDEWQQVLDDEVLVVDVTLFPGDPPEVVASANGRDVVYRATTDEPPGCD